MDNHELDVLPVMRDSERPQYRDTHENLLSPPFRVAIVGASKSGKSNLLMNYLRPCYYGGSKKQKIAPCFNKVIVFSPNLGMDSTTKSLKDLCAEGDIHMNYSDGYIRAIIDYQKMSEGNVRDKILIIADDLIAMGCQPQSLIFSSATYLRHLDVSIFYLTQTYKGHYSLPPLVRNNLDGIVMFKCPSFQQINSFSEDLQGTFGSKDNVKKMLDYATRKPFHFSFFNYRDLEVWHNHTDKIWQKFDENNDYNPDFGVGANSDEVTE
tara:strand:+ start:627 stop:1424 length:798 start_codon:yes stop_codon:yes gene_type:complete